MFNFIEADILSLSLFVIFSVVMFGLIVFAVYKTKYKFKLFLVLFLGYLLVFGLVVKSGLPLKSIIPVAPRLFGSAMLGALIFSLSVYGRRVGQVFSLSVLIGFQAFRLPLELILHHWAKLGTIPETMTWTGQNFDVVTGVLSLVAIPFVRKSRTVAWGVSMIGFLLLANVIRVVIMSSPFPFAWELEQPLLLIGYLPYAFIVPLFVGAALAGHLIVFRYLWGSR